MFSALVVENNQKTCTLYQSFLDTQGYAVCTASDAEEAIGIFESNHIDIILCDTVLTSIDGHAVIGTIRAMSEEVPIVALSPTGDFQAKQRAFSAGADDFMEKPVDLNELNLRMTALLRRAHIASKQRITVGSAVLDSSSFTVVDGPVSVVLPPKEFKVLFKLCASPGRIFTRRDIMNDVWGIHAKSNERTVDVHIKRLRGRFRGNKSFKIETVRGVGYKAVVPK